MRGPWVINIIMLKPSPSRLWWAPSWKRELMCNDDGQRCASTRGRVINLHMIGRWIDQHLRAGHASFYFLDIEEEARSSSSLSSILTNSLVLSNALNLIRVAICRPGWHWNCQKEERKKKRLSLRRPDIFSQIHNYSDLEESAHSVQSRLLS